MCQIQKGKTKSCHHTSLPTLNIFFMDTTLLIADAGFLTTAIVTSIMDGNTAMYNTITRQEQCIILSQR